MLTFEEVCKRAGGRRRYNAWRQFMRTLRRVEVVRRVRETGFYPGQAAALAEQFGVCRMTISRDLAAIRRGRIDE